MNLRKVCTLILAVFTSLIILSGYSTSHHWRGGQLVVAPSLPSEVIADGGGPAPPYPPNASFGTLIADGGGPAPPYPPSASFGTLIADGGGPAPPYPPNPSFGTLIADGGGPARPYPPSFATHVV
ncbi:MAG TPA: hypothetical protein VNY81_04610 [Candidatus Saccharimonadales bacterium]|nr:hypothetical protein [Candidatus Saccharimonadales bacterium]